MIKKYLGTNRYPSFWGLNVDNFLSDIVNEIDNCFDGSCYTSSYRLSSIPSDVQTLDDKYVVEMELPRYNKEDINISLDDQILTVKAAIIKKEEDKEVETRKLSKSVRLAKSVNPEKIKATLVNGILSIELPFDEKYTAKTISIS
jgi:HSP20 family protein